MIKAYCVFNDFDRDACRIIRAAGVQLDISRSNRRPNKEELNDLFVKYDILIIGVKEKFTKDMLDLVNNK